MINIVVTIWLGFASAPAVCSPAWFRRPERPDARTFFVAEPTSDSVYVGDFFHGSRGVTKVRPDYNPPPTRVFGQIATITRVQTEAGPRLKVGGRIVLIWWGFDTGCQTTVPYKSTLAQPGSKIFLSLDPRPRGEWINGLPTYDAKTILMGRNDMWIPDREDGVLRFGRGDSVRVDVMTADEYFEMHRHFPAGKDTPTTWRARLINFLKWADRNQSLMRKYPGCSIVATERVNAHPNYNQPLQSSAPECDNGKPF